MKKSLMLAVIFIIAMQVCFSDVALAPAINKPDNIPQEGDMAALPVSFNLPGVTPALKAGFRRSGVDGLDNAYAADPADFISDGIALVQKDGEILYDGGLHFFYFAYGGKGLRITLSASAKMTDDLTGDTVDWVVEIGAGNTSIPGGYESNLSSSGLAGGSVVFSHDPASMFSSYASYPLGIKVPSYLDSAAGTYSGELLITVEMK